MATEIIGYSAGCCLSITLIPQIYKIYKTKKATDLSVYFLGFNLLTCFLFFTYGILLEEYPIIMANIILIVQNLILLLFKYFYNSSD